MAYTRRAVRLKWSSTERAFYIRQDGFAPFESKKAKYGRNLTTGRLLRAYAPASFRIIMGVFIVRDSPSATLDGVAEGSIAELKAAHAADDLQCQAQGDSGYWNAEWKGDWPPMIDYDPLANLISVPALLEERLNT